MPLHVPPSPEELYYQITLLLTYLGVSPQDEDAHRRLREAALAYHAAEGRGLSMIDLVKRAPRDPVPRVVHAAKRCAFDPANRALLLQYLRAVEDAERAGLAAEPVRRWLQKVIDDAGDAGSGVPRPPGSKPPSLDVRLDEPPAPDVGRA